MADGDLVANAGGQRRRLRAERSGFADAGHSQGIRLVDQTFHHQHPEGNAEVHAGGGQECRAGAEGNEELEAQNDQATLRTESVLRLTLFHARHKR